MTKLAKNQQFYFTEKIKILRAEIKTLEAKITKLTKKKSIYRHYKGSQYKLLCLARDEETTLPVAVYQCLNTGQIWVRNARVFGERFKLISAGGE